MRSAASTAVGGHGAGGRSQDEAAQALQASRSQPGVDAASGSAPGDAWEDGRSPRGDFDSWKVAATLCSRAQHLPIPQHAHCSNASRGRWRRPYICRCMLRPAAATLCPRRTCIVCSWHPCARLPSTLRHSPWRPSPWAGAHARHARAARARMLRAALATHAAPPWEGSPSSLRALAQHSTHTTQPVQPSPQAASPVVGPSSWSALTLRDGWVHVAGLPHALQTAGWGYPEPMMGCGTTYPAVSPSRLTTGEGRGGWAVGCGEQRLARGRAARCLPPTATTVAGRQV
jgi:hypothetical protein